MIRYKFGLIIGKILVFVLRLKGSSATALPGLVVEKICPEFLAISKQQIKNVIAITGTNGKTSTQTLLSHILEDMYKGKVLVNSKGANLSRGLISQIIKEFSVLGDNEYRFGVFEVEEATLPRIITQIAPDYLIVTNFFRDQLDAYGEIERTKMHVSNAIKLIPEMFLVLNGDDPNVVDLVKDLLNDRKYVHIDNFDKYLSYEDADVDAVVSEDLIADQTIILPESNITSDVTPEFEIENVKFQMQLPGFYSYYSFAFCYGVLRVFDEKLDTRLDQLSESVKQCPPAFGRGEKISDFQIFLVKNPVGFNLILDTFKLIEDEITLVILVNDKTADGKDVSWLWDSELERLKEVNYKKIYFSGRRRQDMFLRVKYALGLLQQKDEKGRQKTSKRLDTQGRVYEVKENYKDLVSQIKKSNDKNIKVISTYTAMNEFRDFLLS
jgi:UDP-N-acetylmuramyl tripeptide synthase